MRQNDQIIAANGGELTLEGILVVVSVVLLFVGDELLGCLFAAADVVVYVVDQAEGVGAVTELEVDAVAAGLALNAGTLFGCVVLENQLLQKQESSFVIHALAYLYL